MELRRVGLLLMAIGGALTFVSCLLSGFSPTFIEIDYRPPKVRVNHVWCRISPLTSLISETFPYLIGGVGGLLSLLSIAMRGRKAVYASSAAFLLSGFALLPFYPLIPPIPGGEIRILPGAGFYVALLGVSMIFAGSVLRFKMAHLTLLMLILLLAPMVPLAALAYDPWLLLHPFFMSINLLQLMIPLALMLWGLWGLTFLATLAPANYQQCEE